MESGEYARHVWAQNTTQACKLACMHAMCVHAQDHISDKLSQIREIKVYIESGEHVRPVWAHSLTQECKLSCMHAMCLYAEANISAKLGCIRKIKASIESGEHAGPVRAHSLTWPCKHACKHTMCLCAQAHISANLGQIGKIEIYRIGGTCQSCTHASVHTHYFQPNWFGSERSKYLQNQENIPDLYEHIFWP